MLVFVVEKEAVKRTALCREKKFWSVRVLTMVTLPKFEAIPSTTMPLNTLLILFSIIEKQLRLKSLIPFLGK